MTGETEGLTLEEALRGISRLAEKDVEAAVVFLTQCLKTNPADRPSARDLHIENAWLASGKTCSVDIVWKIMFNTTGLNNVPYQSATNQDK
ncbi:hypothetical protein C8J56DRAFT_149604 [Mycena floridula]|nr:hypothetical protein C8J56DRAFT_149604 [Mycena floridula]